MTRDSVRERGARPFERGLPLDTATLVVLLIVLGVLLRFAIAGPYLPFSGFRVDVGDFSIWASRMVSQGPGQFYQPGYLADYPPGYMYVLWLLGGIGELFRPIFGLSITPGLIKVPGILADGGVAWLLFLYARRFGDRWLGSWSGERLGLVAVVIYLFNPGTIFDSAVWGQVDSVGTLVVMATLYWLARGWTEAAAAGAVLAMLVKFQFGFLIPLVAIVGIKRHLFGRSSDPEHAGRADPLRVLTSLAAGLGTLVLVILPFRLAIWAPSDPNLSLVDRLVAASNTYQGLTVNAFNLWRNPWTGLGDVYRWGCDTTPPTCADGSGIAFSLGSMPVSWQLVGALLFGIAALVALWTIARRDDPAGILVGALTLAVAFFALPTRVHERYLFPALALAAPLVARTWKWATLYGVLTLSFFANVYWLYTTDFSFAGGQYPMNPGLFREPMPRDPVLASVVFNDTGIYLLSLMIVIALAWLLIRAAGMALGVAEEGGLPSAQGVTPKGVTPATRGGPAIALEGPPEPRRWRLPDWLRRDPSHREDPPRRLDRLDLLLLAVVVLVAFFFRLWRLELPRHTHFDEVYHARTATEWLATWQEGWTRDTYEWTHPPLAKYLIAAGIVLADPNKVVRETDLDAPATSLAVAPQRTAHTRPSSIVFTSAGDDLITAREVLTGKEVASWTALGAVSSLAYDEEGDRLLVGYASGGAVSAYDLTAFLGQLGERGPPPGVAQIETGLSGVDQIAFGGQTVILFRGPNGIVEVERETGVELASSELAVSGVAYVPSGTGDEPAGPSVVAVDQARSSLLVLDAGTLQPSTTAGADGAIELPSVPAGPVLVQGTGKNLQVWVPIGPLPADDEHGPVLGGLTVFDENTQLIDTVPLPGPATAIGWQQVANIVYVAGIDARTDEPVVWTVSPLGNGGTQSAGFAAFDTTVLPGEGLAMGFDISDEAQDDDHGLLLVSTADGSGGPSRIVSIDAGSNAFAWRLAGIFFGAALVGIIYLFAATLFPRRRIAVLAAAFVAFDGMSYVMSRISMNDIFVATFIIAGYALFWQIWSGRWLRSAWWVLPLVGVLIGLAAASKWVGWYALIGIWVLVLARSQFGRFLLVAGIAFITVISGFGAPWPFLVVCVMALALALLLVWRRPIQLSPTDILALPPIGVVGGGIGLAFAIAYSQVEGREPRSAVEFIFAFLARGAQAAWPAWIMLTVAGLLLLARAVRSWRDPASDRRWHLPGEMGGFAWPWVGACLLVVPLLVYFVAYIPYLQLGHGIATQNLGPGYGWSLDEMQSQMFGYHFGLQAGHPAASPWWSWPLDLKPVWFYSHSYDNRQLAVIYNGGNPILFWAGIPAIAWCAVQAWRHRSLALVLVVAAFAFQYLPWTRIERATFHYHYFTAVLIAMIAVAYAVDQGLRSWSYRSLAIAFLVAAVVSGILIFPLGSALAMPDWYVNAARALAPWNYAFKFPDPPQGDRGQLLSADSLKLAIGTLVSLGAAAFALFGRDLFDRRQRVSAAPGPAASGLALAQSPEEEQHPDQNEAERPEPVEVEVREVLLPEEVEADHHQDQPEDPRPTS